jgi:hypothetical protein
MLHKAGHDSPILPPDAQEQGRADRAFGGILGEDRQLKTARTFPSTEYLPPQMIPYTLTPWEAGGSSHPPTNYVASLTNKAAEHEVVAMRSELRQGCARLLPYVANLCETERLLVCK